MSIEEAGTEEKPVEEKESREDLEQTVEAAEEVKEEKKPAEERKEEEEIVEERVYTVPLGRAWIAPHTKRSPRAMRMLKSFVERHMKVEGDSVKILNEVNERVWSKGIEKPPRRIRIRATKDTEGVVTVHLAEGS